MNERTQEAVVDFETSEHLCAAESIVREVALDPVPSQALPIEALLVGRMPDVLVDRREGSRQIPLLLWSAHEGIEVLQEEVVDRQGSS
jgi:hypothetical protein